MGLLVPTFLALACGAVHWYHVSSLLENEKHFSHLSELEREMSFRSEQGFYYSFYKRLIGSKSLLQGIDELSRDEFTEAPDTINVFQRFTIFPELVLAAAYKLLSWLEQQLQLSWRQCWRVSRDGGAAAVASTVWSCVGPTDPVIFYIYGVWSCAFVTASALFLLGRQISGSCLGGLLAFLCYLFNHGEATRVMWAPPLRENFALPLLLLQLLALMRALAAPVSPTFTQLVAVMTASALALVTWQLSHFWLLLQLFSLHSLWIIRLAPSRFYLLYLITMLCGVLAAFPLGHCNSSLLYSGLSLCLVGAVAIYALANITSATWRRIAATLFVLPLLQAAQLQLSDQSDSHVWRLLLVKLGISGSGGGGGGGGGGDFDTALYTCEEAFQYIGWQSLTALTHTLLLPSAIVAAAALLLLLPLVTAQSKSGRGCDGLGKQQLQQLQLLQLPSLLLLLLQTAGACVMAVLFMRLKLLATPLLTVWTAGLTNRQVAVRAGGWRVYSVLLTLLVACMLPAGLDNIRQQHSIIGEFSDIQLEETLLWIKHNTAQRARFAAPMALTPAVLLSTGRPIVNHPHYESHQSRYRTRLVYSVFGQVSVQHVHDSLRILHTDYVLLPHPLCLGPHRSGCSLTEIWQLTMANKTGIAAARSPAACAQLLLLADPRPFSRVFANQLYTVLWLGPAGNETGQTNAANAARSKPPGRHTSGYYTGRVPTQQPL